MIWDCCSLQENKPPVLLFSDTAPHPFKEASVVNVAEGEPLYISPYALWIFESHYKIFGMLLYVNLVYASKFPLFWAKALTLFRSKSL